MSWPQEQKYLIEEKKTMIIYKEDSFQDKRGDSVW